MAPLARQGSVYSLTFDRSQSTLGGAAASCGGSRGIPKGFGSVNMDELLQSIWTAEETQAKASASASIAGASAGMPPTPMQRQGSSLTLPRMLSTKTVDEAWRNLVRDEPPQGADGGGHQPHHRQSTLGEMTLEEFLVRDSELARSRRTPLLLLQRRHPWCRRGRYLLPLKAPPFLGIYRVPTTTQLRQR